jgi:hypothetical protein
MHNKEELDTFSRGCNFVGIRVTHESTNFDPLQTMMIPLCVLTKFINLYDYYYYYFFGY